MSKIAAFLKSGWKAKLIVVAVLVVVVVAGMVAVNLGGKGEKFGEEFPDGRPKTAGRYVLNESGKPVRHGPYTEWYENGNKKFECVYNKGRRDGKVVNYWENGNTKSVSHFDNDIPHGKYVTYWKNGNKKFEGTLREGLRVGDWIEYDELGNPQSKVRHEEKKEDLKPAALDDAMGDGLGKDF